MVGRQGHCLDLAEPRYRDRNLAKPGRVRPTAQPAMPEQVSAQHDEAAAVGSRGFPPDLHDTHHLWLKASLLTVWVVVTFGGRILPASCKKEGGNGAIGWQPKARCWSFWPLWCSTRGPWHGLSGVMPKRPIPAHPPCWKMGLMTQPPDRPGIRALHARAYSLALAPFCGAVRCRRAGVSGLYGLGGAPGPVAVVDWPDLFVRHGDGVCADRVFRGARAVPRNTTSLGGAFPPFTTVWPRQPTG